MKAAAFLKKEIKFYLSPARLCSVPLVFLLFALISPVFAKYTREIIGSLEPSLLKMIPLPVLSDAYAQFIKNIGQLGFLVMIIIFSGIVVQEKERGTAVLMLTRPLSRSTFIWVKYTGAFLYYTASYLICAGGFYLYTYLMFGKLGYSPFLSLFSFYLYGLVFVFLTVLLSTLASNPIPAAIAGISVFFVLGILASIPKLSAWLPTQFSVFTVTLATAPVSASDFCKPLAISLLLIILSPLASVYFFRRQEL